VYGVSYQRIEEKMIYEVGNAIINVKYIEAVDIIYQAEGGKEADIRIYFNGRIRPMFFNFKSPEIAKIEFDEICQSMKNSGGK